MNTNRNRNRYSKKSNNTNSDLKAISNCDNKCSNSINSIFDKYSILFSDYNTENKLCLIKCTDKLNFPSEELTCYDMCEEEYNNKIKGLKEKLYDDMNKLII